MSAAQPMSIAPAFEMQQTERAGLEELNQFIDRELFLLEQYEEARQWEQDRWGR